MAPGCGPTQSPSYPISVNALKVLRFLQANDYPTVNRLKVDASLARELETVMRGYLRYLLERELKSADWLDTMRRQAGEDAPGMP